MPRFEIHIMDTDVSAGPLAPSQPTPYVRSVVTTQEAEDGDAAVKGAWNAWRAKYGEDEWPAADATYIYVKRLDQTDEPD